MIRRFAPRVILFVARGASVLFLCATASLCLGSLPLEQQFKPGAGANSPIRDPEVIDAQGFRDVLKRYHGQPLLVYFWATWCEPCRDEYPMLNQLANQYASQGLVVVGISLDDDGEITQVRRFLARTRPVFPNYRKRPGSEEAFIRTVNPRWRGAIPATFFYLRDGRELLHLVGEHNREEFEKAIRALLETNPKNTSHVGTKSHPPGH
jgi:thiol-disulfide isomerase/thioredoxin